MISRMLNWIFERPGSLSGRADRRFPVLDWGDHDRQLRVHYTARANAPPVSGIMKRAMTQENSEPQAVPSNFLREIIAEDLRNKKYGDAIIQTRFPPEPNGYLHIGHAKAICIDFGLADEVGGKTNLRFDDTNPEKEEQEYVDSIMADVRWLGFDWDRLCYASDYFGQLYQWALQLVKAGKAYVDDLTADEIRRHRGTLTEPARTRPIATALSKRTSTCSRA